MRRERSGERSSVSASPEVSETRMLGKTPVGDAWGDGDLPNGKVSLA